MAGIIRTLGKGIVEVDTWGVALTEHRSNYSDLVALWHGTFDHSRWLNGYRLGRKGAEVRWCRAYGDRLGSLPPLPLQVPIAALIGTGLVT